MIGKKVIAFVELGFSFIFFVAAIVNLVKWSNAFPLIGLSGSMALAAFGLFAILHKSKAEEPNIKPHYFKTTSEYVHRIVAIAAIIWYFSFLTASFVFVVVLQLVFARGNLTFLIIGSGVPLVSCLVFHAISLALTYKQQSDYVRLEQLEVLKEIAEKK